MAETATLTDFIVPIDINGLHGRMLNLPPSRRGKKREILLLYGSHSSIERMAGLADELSKYGNVTLPDLPGFGGMDSFYKIGKKPSLDNMADYLATFIKLRYSRKRITIMGFSLGFLIATRMLQKHPELVKKVDLVVSIVGFTHYNEFIFKRHNYLMMRIGASIFSNRLPAWTARSFFLRGPFIRGTYAMVANKNNKLKGADRAQQRNLVDFEIVLWRQNDLRTYMDTAVTMLTVNVCDKKIDLPVYHVAVDSDQYFDNYVVEQHLAIIYSEVNVVKTSLPAHMPTVLATAEEVAPFIPPKIRRLLNAKP